MSVLHQSTTSLLLNPEPLTTEGSKPTTEGSRLLHGAVRAFLSLQPYTLCPTPPSVLKRSTLNPKTYTGRPRHVPHREQVLIRQRGLN